MKLLNILVVEDDALQGMMLGEILEELGHRVCSVTSTVSGAVAAVEKHTPELLIVDAWLKDGSGISLIDKVCRKGHIPHLFVTGDVARIRLARPHAVMIQKPYQIVELEAAIQRAIVAEPHALI
jgi:two-component system, response regulator PdtaR